ncbi:MAG: D-2-hydroxyacid dehydrogenase [Betaproteobacteria bacterium]|nr:D-2-hydroxyacid dehydrogenase [Betaproteobacteria bacterium]
MHRIVYLHRASLEARVRRPSFPHEWIEHANTLAADLAERLRGASIAISNKLAMPRSMLEASHDLKLIAVAATGTNHIDLACCRERGIAVCNVRDYSRHTLPEHVFMLLLALRRQLPAYRAAVVAGEWQRAEGFYVPGPELTDLHGSTLGIVGRGSIGGNVAALAQAFGMRVLCAERRGARHARAGYTPFEEVLREADAITLHCPLTADTERLIGEPELRMMKRSALLINTARGPLVDEVALARALAEGRIAGAGIDVLTEEPPSSGSPLLDLSLPNLIITPHIAWSGAQAKQLLADALIDNIEAWARGEPKNLVE